MILYVIKVLWIQLIQFNRQFVCNCAYVSLSTKFLSSTLYKCTNLMAKIIKYYNACKSSVDGCYCFRYRCCRRCFSDFHYTIHTRIHCIVLCISFRRLYGICQWKLELRVKMENVFFKKELKREKVTENK